MRTEYINGQLHFAGRKLQDLLDQEGSPLYVYDLKGIINQWKLFSSHIPKPCGVHYAMKANSNKRILQALASISKENSRENFSEDGVDVVSMGEMELAIQCGFSPSTLIFSGVSKTKKEIQRALELEIKLINVESPQELQRIAEIASSMNRAASVSFRMNPDVHPSTHPYITTGFRENKFGMDVDFLPELKEILDLHPKHLVLKGLSIHIGSQMLNFEALHDSLQKMIPLFIELRKKYSGMQYFNVGGGVGIPYSSGERSASLKEYQSILELHLSPLNCTILCEPGRYIVGPFGILLSEIQYLKEGPYKNFIMLDTGMNHLIRPALYGSQHQVLPFRELALGKKADSMELGYTSKGNKAAGGMKVFDVVGPICESSDVLARSLAFDGICSGEGLAILDTGAYGYSMSSTYNTRPLPKEVVLE